MRPFFRVQGLSALWALKGARLRRRLCKKVVQKDCGKRFLSLTARRAEGGGIACGSTAWPGFRVFKRFCLPLAGRFKGACRKVLRFDRPLAGGFLSLTARRAEGGIACGSTAWPGFRGFKRFRGFRGWWYRRFAAMSFIIPLRGIENQTTALWAEPIFRRETHEP